MDPTQVSVVIPTVDRLQLGRAIRSVREQQFDGLIEIIVVVDGKHTTGGNEVTAHDADLVVRTGQQLGAAAARNLGLLQASGQWIAFLDDDDEWLPRKLSEQIAVCEAIARSGRLAICASRHIQVNSTSGRIGPPAPLRTYAGGTVEDYLFRQRRPGGGRASLYTSTLVCDRKVAQSAPWDAGLQRHQDWDWLMRATRLPGALLVQHPDALVRIHTGSAGSISATNNWEGSLLWADDKLSAGSDRIYVDFLTAQCLRYAIQARSCRGVRAVSQRLIHRRVLPSSGPMAIALSGILPRRALERLMTMIR